MYDEYYSLAIPERVNMTQMVLDRWAERAGSERRPAIFYEDEVISYKELLGIVNRIGNALRRKGSAGEIGC